MRLLFNSAEQLFSYAEKEYSKRCSGLETILLFGPLGVGKTLFVKGLCSGWGLNPQDVVSPTFNICFEYQGVYNIFHCDLYRLVDPQEFVLIGGLDYFKEGICLIEWPELIQDFWPENAWRVYFSFSDNNSRSLIFSF